MKIGGTRYRPLFVTASHLMLVDVTSRLTAFSLRLTPSRPTNPSLETVAFMGAK